MTTLLGKFLTSRALLGLPPGHMNMGKGDEEERKDLYF